MTAPPASRRPARRAGRIAAALLAVMVALMLGAGVASAGPPPGLNTLFFSPSSSGGCGDGQISAVGEASAPGQSPTTPITMSASDSIVSVPGASPSLVGASGLRAFGMASTSWGYAFGSPWQAGDPSFAWNTQVYFTNSCANTRTWLYASCYAAWTPSEFSPNPLIGCPRNPGIAMDGPPQSLPPWVAFTAPQNQPGQPASQWIGQGVAVDVTRGIVYFTTVPAGCEGNMTCAASVWSAPVATQWNQTLSPTLMAQLPTNGNPSYMAVDPITRSVFLVGGAGGSVVSLPATGGTPTTMPVTIPSGLVAGLAVDPSTSTVYVASAQMGSRPNVILAVPETGCCTTTLFTGAELANPLQVSNVAGLAVDPANAVIMWANTPGPSGAAGEANTLSWGSLDGSAGDTWSWAGLPSASWVANVGAITLAGGVGTCQADSTTYRCPTTSVAAAGTTARAGAALSIPVVAYVVAAPQSGTVSGPMVVTLRDRLATAGRTRTYATLRPGFVVRPNTKSLRQVTLPAVAREALRRGRLEVVVRTRRAGVGQAWRTRVLRVIPR